MLDHTTSIQGPEARRDWMSTLAKARSQDLIDAWNTLPERPRFTALRAPEHGLVLVRGRMGGAGSPFNVGEMTVTRAAVRLETGETGVSYVAGRSREHAEIAAAVDAMMQSVALRPMVEADIIETLKAAHETRRTLAARKAAATRVDFFTMVRDRGPA